MKTRQEATAFHVDEAKSDKTRCAHKECDKEKRKILKGQMRLLMQEGTKKGSRKWYHYPRCVPLSVLSSLHALFGSPEQVPGMDDLPKDKVEAAAAYVESQLSQKQLQKKFEEALDEALPVQSPEKMLAAGEASAASSTSLPDKKRKADSTPPHTPVAKKSDQK